uniref:Uncharacterized protein n=1 Tax=Avena sativa TaxID=4498 RepID=A0ACD5V0X9_AVESA
MAQLCFVTRRGDPVLVQPIHPTPRELKRLSDLDDQESLRFYRSVIYFYRRSQQPRGDDPATIIRGALAAALVYYYPMAGRLVELPADRKLLVDCTGEGVSFVEADADVALDDFGGDTLCPPVPCAAELLCLPERSSAAVVNRPLLYVQVTRLTCGGFVLGVQVCHSLVDAPGIKQFLIAVGELARGMEAPSVRPVWARELLDARDQPLANYHHPEYDLVADDDDDKLLRVRVPGGAAEEEVVLVHRAFRFGAKELRLLREQLPPAMRRSRCTTRFLLLSAFVWRCRTAALGYEPGEQVRFMFVMNARGRVRRPLPEGFYGNALVFGVAETTAGELCSGSLGSAVQLIAAAKARIAREDDYAQSVADALVLRGRPRIALPPTTYLVTDITKWNLHEVDLGWGMPVYGGPATTTLATFHMPAPGGGITVPMSLPQRAMDRFAANVQKAVVDGESAIRSRI